MSKRADARALELIKADGFRKLGNITVGNSRRLSFPRPPDGGGLYFILLNAGGYYVGETAQYGNYKGKSGRFSNYINPADDIWTELVINSMLLAGGGGTIYIRDESSATKPELRKMEAAVVRRFVKEGIPLWNDGGGRCEKAYLAWKIPIIERMLRDASNRYTGRGALTPYARRRLKKLPVDLAKARAAARQLGLKVANSSLKSPLRHNAGLTRASSKPRSTSLVGLISRIYRLIGSIFRS